MSTVRFEDEDLALFAAASHDVNPLHMSETYARATPYGQRVVFGVLGGLTALSRLAARPGMALAGVTLDFRNPLFVGVEYAVDVLKDTSEQAQVRIVDAGRVLLTATASFRPVSAPLPPGDDGALQHRAEAMDREPDTCVEGLDVAGAYAPAVPHLQRLIARWGLQDRGIAPGQLAVLLWSSYLIGMELPGRRAAFYRAALTWEAEGDHAAAPLGYRARVAKRDRRFDLLHIEAELAASDQRVATAELSAFVRADSPFPSPAAIEALLPRSSVLAGTTALVVGGSRGLGAAISQALALQGSTVLVTYQRSEAEARRLAASVSDAPGRVELLPGDGADPGWCAEAARGIGATHGGLDLLVCNASPAIQPLAFTADTLGRFQDFVVRSLGLVSAPLFAFLPGLAERAGRCVLVSSAYVRTTPADWPHYVAAKAAAEGLVRWAAVRHPRAGFLIARPPKLLTDQTNTPLGQQGALPVERVAAALTQRLIQPAATGVEMIEEF